MKKLLTGIMAIVVVEVVFVYGQVVGEARAKKASKCGGGCKCGHNDAGDEPDAVDLHTSLQSIADIIDDISLIEGRLDDLSIDIETIKSTLGDSLSRDR